jgi:hypothetical protein
MAKKPEPPLLSTFDVFRVAHKAIWLGTVEASDERDAIQGVIRERDIPVGGNDGHPHKLGTRAGVEAARQQPRWHQ